jgi:hypothetical protein
MTRLQVLRKASSRMFVRLAVKTLVTSYWVQMTLPYAVHLDLAGDLYETFSGL